MTIETLGIDIAKNVFQLHGVNRGGRVVFKRRVMRDQLLEVVSRLDHMHGDMPRCIPLLIASYFNWGKLAKAHDQAERLMHFYPDFRVSDLRWPFRQDKDWDRLVRALVDAQLPP